MTERPDQTAIDNLAAFLLAMGPEEAGAALLAVLDSVCTNLVQVYGRPPHRSNEFVVALGDGVIEAIRSMPPPWTRH